MIPIMLEPDREVLFFPDLLPEDQYADKEQIDAQCDRRMIPAMLPCLFHLLAPVNVVQYHNGKIIGFLKNRLKVLDGWPETMITVDEGENRRALYTLNRWSQRVVEVSGHRLNICQV